LAKTVSATLGAGYRQTIFTRHAPTIHCSIEEFDQEMSELFEEQRISPPDSRRVALERLISIVADLDRQLSVSG